MKTLHVALVGCGSIGQYHLATLVEDSDVEVTALVSTNPATGRVARAKVPGARLYEDVEDLYRSEKDLDAVLVCVPPDRHGAAEVRAAERGIHLYIEKPVEISLGRAREIEAAIGTSGIISSVAYQERYRPGLVALRNYIRGRKTGLAHGYFLSSIPAAPWWRRRERSAGQVVEQCTHIFDLLRWFFGEPRLVYSAPVKGMVENVPGYDLDDASATTVVFHNGTAASVLTGCYLAPSAGDHVGLRVVCADAMVEYDWEKEIRYLERGRTETSPAVENTRKLALQAFLKAVRAGGSAGIQSPYPDALKTLALTLAANRSMETGLPVSM